MFDKHGVAVFKTGLFLPSKVRANFADERRYNEVRSERALGIGISKTFEDHFMNG